MHERTTPGPGAPLPVHEIASGEWRIQPREGTIVRGSERRLLGRQQMELLLLLVGNSERAVSKDEIFEALWGGVTVEPGALPRCISELRKSLDDDARDPRYIRTLPKRGYRWVAAVRTPEAAAPARPPRRRRPKRRVALAGAFAAVALGLLALGWLGASRFDSAGRGPRGPVVAVIGFSDLSGEPGSGWIGTALAELLSTDLARDRYRVIPGETIARLKQELSIPAADSFAVETLARVRASVGADYVVSGSYVSQPARQELRVDVKVQDSASGETIAALIEHGSAEDFLGLISRAGARLRALLGSDDERIFDFDPHLTRSPAATRAYFEGLMHLRQLNAPAARDSLELVVEQVPDHPFAHAALADAWSAMGYRGRAVEHAERGLAAATDLPREQQVWLEARMLEVSQRRPEAIELYRALWVFAPHNTEYGLRLARLQAEADEPEQALLTVQRVQNGSERPLRDPRLDLIEAQAARRLADHRRAVAAAERAEMLGGELGARWVVARARHARALSLYKLGRVDEALEAIELARQAYRGSGRAREEAATNLALGGWLANHGEFARARAALDAALDGYREAGDRAGEASVLGELANQVGETGDLVAARRMLDEAIETYREIGDRRGEAGVLNQRAIVLAKNGEHAGAREAFDRSVAIYRELGDRERVAVGLMNLGKLDLLGARPEDALLKLREAERDLAELDLTSRLATVRFNLGYAALVTGRHREAVKTFESTVALYRELKNPRMLAASLAGQGEALVGLDQPVAAEAALREALELRLEIGEPVRIADSRVALVKCLLARGRVDEALGLARVAADGSEVGDVELSALAVLVSALLEKGLVEDAADVIDRGAERWAEDRLESERDLEFAVSAARVRSRLGRVEDARRLLDEVLMVTSSRRAWVLYSAAAFARCETDQLAGSVDSARSCWSALESEARSRGLVAVAGRARVASGGGLDAQ